MFFLPQGANIQIKSSKEINPIQKFDTKISFPNPYDENLNQEHKTLQNNAWTSWRNKVQTNAQQG